MCAYYYGNKILNQKICFIYSILLICLGNVWQLEHVFRLGMPYISDKLYIAGFIDHTFNQRLADNLPESPIVAEVQLGYRIYENLYLIAEYRINEYRRSDVNNLAVGIEYKLIW